jgi:segregation and condensation protein A
MDDSAPLEGAPEGAGQTPHLTLEGFAGPLDQLLALARAQTIDLSRLPLGELVDQLALALRQARGTLALGQKADWVVMTAWLLQLRSLLLLPPDTPAQQEAAAEAGALRRRLVALADVQALAGWLDRRPQLGHDVFARGRPEIFSAASADAAPAIDVIEFLWASLALFDDDPAPETAAIYQPRPLNLYPVAAARDRILRRLGVAPGGGPLEQFLPDPPASEAWTPLRRRSAWSSTFAAALELAKQGQVVLGQGEDFEPIHIAPA